MMMMMMMMMMMIGKCANLILAVRVLRVLEESIGESKDGLQAVLVVLELGSERRHRATGVRVGLEGRLEQAKHLVQYVLLAHQLLSFSARLLGLVLMLLLLLLLLLLNVA